MDLYTSTSYRLAEELTKSYSTSFSMSSRLFDIPTSKHVYAIYGLVRIADEVVDTYMGEYTLEKLDTLEAHVYEQLKLRSPFSTNPIVHAFVVTAKQFDIDESLISPFFKSMRTDITKSRFTEAEYVEYIYGSADVIGLMCLRIFTGGNNDQYRALETGAKSLGSAYQKVNFLRDIKADFDERGRVYFPGVTYETFSDEDKRAIEVDIERDFESARKTLQLLPDSARKAVKTSYEYYWQLFLILKKASAEEIKTKRLRVPTAVKIALYAKAKAAL